MPTTPTSSTYAVVCGNWDAEGTEYPDGVSSPHFRAGVILVIARGDGAVMAFERSDVPGAWQLPQGGIDEGESVEAAAWRELSEETGLDERHVALRSVRPGWTVYELPPEHRRPGRLGQAHRWCFFEVVDDAVEPRPDGVEFTAWSWMTIGELIAQVAPFRRDGYEEALRGRR